VRAEFTNHFHPPHKNVKNIPPAARPREKLLALGSGALADVELIALLLRSGFKGTPVLQLAQNLLDQFGGLHGLLQAQPADLNRVKGLGPAKRAEIAAVMELARRALKQELTSQPVLKTRERIKEYLQLQMKHHTREVFAVLFLDVQYHLVAFEELFQGTVNQASVYPREVVKRALLLGATAVILAHNHPSGMVEPSNADEMLTMNLQQALKLVDVEVLDHLVIGGNAVFSFAEHGWL
jgi:DNA repair protein RadC